MAMPRIAVPSDPTAPRVIAATLPEERHDAPAAALRGLLIGGAIVLPFWAAVTAAIWNIVR